MDSCSLDVSSVLLSVNSSIFNFVDFEQEFVLKDGMWYARNNCNRNEVPILSKNWSFCVTQFSISVWKLLMSWGKMFYDIFSVSSITISDSIQKLFDEKYRDDYEHNLQLGSTWRQGKLENAFSKRISTPFLS